MQVTQFDDGCDDRLMVADAELRQITPHSLEFDE